MNNIGLSDRIRTFARSKYVEPAVTEGRSRFSIRVRDVNNELRSQGFPRHHTPQICNALTGRKFLRENSLEIDKIDGPPSGQSPTVVVHYRIETSGQSVATPAMQPQPRNDTHPEDPSMRAYRLTERLRGILKDELAEYGGGEAFLRWIRSDDEDAA
ncbi:MAG TPA: hypothetical protein VG267_12700 [Terracidiphilus sp.]|jgi:hypothetical protein|nr:hypothetical protein [Terracidiphilus sp.]